MKWYYSKDGMQLGPVDQAELEAKLKSGEVSQTSLVWREGMGDWLAASLVPELNGGVSTPGTSIPPAVGHPATGYSHLTIPNYLWQSIVVTILCCWPLGIPAIVYAAKVDGLKHSGDITGALAASSSARTWCWVALGVGLVAILTYLGLVIAGVVSTSSMTSQP